MSTRKTPVAIAAKVDTPTNDIGAASPTVLAEEKDGVKKSNDPSEATASGKTVIENKSKTETDILETSAATTTTTATATSVQKENPKTIGNNRITRNSPLLSISPTSKKEKPPSNADSELTNSESEDGSVASTAAKKQIRGRKSIKDGKDGKEVAKEDTTKQTEESSLENNENQESDAKESSEGVKETQDKDIEDSKNGDERTEESDCTDVKESENIHPKEIQEKEENEKDVKNLEEKSPTDLKDNKEKSTKDIKDSKEKDIKEEKEIKDSKESKETGSISNRLTRHAAAQGAASKTRITRNRQSSGNATTRSETPPTTRRGRNCGSNPRKAAENSASQKRKRSIEEAADTQSKVIKIEPKDVSDEPETDGTNSIIIASSNTELEAMKIKEELRDSEDGITNNATSETGAGGNPAITANATSTTGRGRGNRWTGRKPTQTASPTTRSTRQSKGASPAPSISSTSSSTPEPKRRRTGGGTTLKRSSSNSVLKVSGSPALGANATPDEDSKDSMASYMDDILLTELKMEKLTPDLEEGLDVEMEDKTLVEEEIANVKDLPDEEVSTSNGIGEPLTIETDSSVANSAEKEEETNSTLPETASTSSSSVNNNTKKDASLSPEMISEGVSEISVKQFYNKPKFLENNLGIEQDPKLGEIVQKATTIILDDACPLKEEEKVIEQENEKDDDNQGPVNEEDPEIEEPNESAVTRRHNESFSAESLKEGDLLYDESNDSKKLDGSDVEKLEGFPESRENLVIVEEVEVLEEEIPKDVSVPKDEDEPLAERLVIDEDDLEDDDLTVEESESISMDNNPSVHDDAAEEERDGDAEDEQIEELGNVEDLAENGEVIKNHEIIKETKETTKECDTKKAKLKNEKDLLKDIKEQEQQVEIIDEDRDTETKTIRDKQRKESETKKESIEQNVSKNLKSSPKTPNLVLNAENKLDVDKSLIDTKILKVDANESRTGDINQKTEEKNKDKLEKEDAVENMEVDGIKPEEDIEMVMKDSDENSLIKEIQIPMIPLTLCENQEISNNSDSNSPTKSTSSNNQQYLKDDDANSVKSAKSTDANSWTTVENDYDDEEKLRQKEQHFQNLGLLTLKAAEKRRQEFIQTAAAVEASRAAAGGSHHHSKRGSNKTSAATSSTASNNAAGHEYTGTLKTVIKLNRSSGAATGSTTTVTATAASTSNGCNSRKSHAASARDSHSGVRRQSLKMTFQKGRGRGHVAHGNDRNTNTTGGVSNTHSNAHVEDAYYTIQNENEGAQKNTGGTSTATFAAGTKDQQLQKQHINNNNNTSNVQTHGRKPYNSRSNTITSHHYHHLTTNSHIESSHSDTHNDHAHHHAQHSNSGTVTHKKDDREEILIPEKASSFKFHPGRLCEDQCYYCSGKFGLYDTPCHVGQIKSVERQQKILKNEEKLTVDNCLCDACFRHVDRRANVPSYKKRLSASNSFEKTNTSNTDSNNVEDNGNAGAEESEANRKCVVPECEESASHSLRRKCIRKSVKKFLLNFEMPTGSPYILLCQTHYDAVIQCSGCVLCKRRLGKNHMYHITSDTERLEKALTDMGIPVQLGIGTAVCKLCRYFANLLMKPPDSTKFQKAEFVKNYRKRLLQFHNINDGSNEASEADEDENNLNGATTSSAKDSSKSNQSRNRISGKDQNNSHPTKVPVEVNENAMDEGESRQKQTSLLESESLLEYGTSGQNSGVEDTSNENSKSSSPNHVTEDGGGKQSSSRLKAILQSGSGGKTTKATTDTDLPCAVLLSNPNLSMRELFPGEEDLGLNFKAPFGSSNSQRTPEGWTRVQTFLQYDEPTRRLWEELQKPYGNQSSFLRHLILLEKYYRNGDLILSPNASPNASVYTKTVRQRLTSYDQGPFDGSNETNINSVPEEAKSKQPQEVPLVEINDDEEDEPSPKPVANSKENNTSEDVVMQEPPAKLVLRRSRSSSVEKLTKHLSNNAVTIIARSKDTTPTSSVKNPNLPTEVSVEKRSEVPNQKVSITSAATNNTGIPVAPLAPLSCNSSQQPQASATSASLSGIASSSSNSRSILKSNLLGMSNNKNVEILPIATQKANTSSNATTVTATTVNVPSTLSEGGSVTKQQKILDVANKLLGNKIETAAAMAKQHQQQQQQQASLLTSPPELVSFQRRSLPNVSLSSSSSASSSMGNSTINTTATLSSTTSNLINAKRPHLMPNRQSSAPNRGVPPNVVVLPETLSSHERAESKSWRPTLMSVEENQHLLNKNGPLYQTADGRRLPGLVQVQSGGKPFLISIFDYNRMCILRREKILRDQMLKPGRHHKSQQQQHQQHHHQQQRNSQQNSNFNKSNSSSNLNSSSSGGGNNSGNGSGNSKQAQTAAAQQQLMQLMYFQKQQQAAVLKAAASNANTANRYTSIAPKPLQPPSLIPTNANSASGNMMSGSGSSGSSLGGSNNNAIGNRLNINQTSFPMPLLANALSNAAAANAANATFNSNPWLWSNFPDAQELLRSGATGIPSKMPTLMPKPTTIGNTTVLPSATITSKQSQQQQQLLLDNALISKIPKSLTVIPQHKLMGNSSTSSITKE